jgi:hypothetical protein
MSDTLIDDEFAVAPPAAPAAAPVVEAPAAETFKREIDLGDGSGKQVFEGATQDELIDKLAEAQKHATAKIREQNRALKLAPKPQQEKRQPRAKFEPKKFTEDEEFVLAQKWTEAPSKTFNTFVEASFGMNAEKVRERLSLIDEIEQERKEHQAATAFVAAHADYVPDRQELHHDQRISRQQRLSLHQVEPRPRFRGVVVQRIAG